MNGYFSGFMPIEENSNNDSLIDTNFNSGQTLNSTNTNFDPSNDLLNSENKNLTTQENTNFNIAEKDYTQAVTEEYNQETSNFNDELAKALDLERFKNEIENQGVLDPSNKSIAEKEEEDIENESGPGREDITYIGECSLIVKAFIANNAIPLENVKITVTSDSKQLRHIDEVRYTNSSGETTPIYLPTPAVAYSQSPQEKIKPYAIYEVYAELEGYTTYPSPKHSLVFDKTKSVQNIEMVPNPEKF